MTELKGYLQQIKGPDNTAIELAQARLDNLAKPPGSLGELEAIAAKLAGISGQMHYDTTKRCVIIMASDNGVVEEGVALAPQGVTYAHTLNFTTGITGVNVLAKQFNTDLIVVDMGINGEISHPMVINRKIRNGTHNIATGAAMSQDEALKAVLTGVKTAIEAVEKGYKLLGAGEMGIGNTTTTAAVLCALTGIKPEEAAGKGAGLSDETYRHKIHVITKALELNKPNPEDPLDVLAKVGGFDIAAMAGVFIGGAVMGVPVVIDGFISIVAALAAARFNPLIKNFMFASHASAEQGYVHASNALGLKPCLHLNMRLGEGSGCPIMFAVIDAACAILKNMGTFEQGNIDKEYTEAVANEDFHIRGL
ncbi:MAG: nicotinate-nucleotide--dimethylbenzimidazole phosphoribosyltransferase [Defluviitaleaceae bacterium]|nr:nicotinate-nucleotide--dimethylbenzimidazole phosphoribosyltransferase [Defluviitaleaceae bacterium]